ncbi:hypothetical protein U5N28_17520 [Lysinibacillus telephonicus]|uniref:Uncharacterized protein n=1 Tax=Lysinibacillus telephonicus TaxID=1714840 RepID=A0A3S0HV04_9BACI|nr:hypothetical protein [Lysinibacillus telephonicus]RTQ87958.1 hypothetical protein EKG35_18335 [Lysinibacillus telephonicus]
MSVAQISNIIMFPIILFLFIVIVFYVVIASIFKKSRNTLKVKLSLLIFLFISAIIVFAITLNAD